MIRIAVIGTGRMGQVHLQTLSSLPHIQPTLVCDADSTLFDQLAKRYSVQCTDDVQDVWNSDVDAVWICSPATFHVEHIVGAVNSGKHVFCEKPISNDLEKVNQALDEVEKSGQKFMLGFNRRFDTSFSKIKSAIDQGAAGEVLTVLTTSRDPAPPPAEYVRVSGGLFKDMAIHDLDMVRFLMGRNPQTVHAMAANLVDPELKKQDFYGLNSDSIDTALISMQFGDGKVASINICRKASYGYDQRVEVFGTKGVLKAENHFPNMVEKWDETGIGALDLPYDFFHDRYADAYRAESVYFADCLKNDTDPSPSGEDGRQALVLALACDESYRTGKPVEVPQY